MDSNPQQSPQHLVLYYFNLHFSQDQLLSVKNGKVKAIQKMVQKKRMLLIPSSDPILDPTKARGKDLPYMDSEGKSALKGKTSTIKTSKRSF